MARGGGRRTYVRDGRGRFASTPGGGAPKRPPTRRASRSPGRLTRDNAGRITSIGGNGATARGGRLRTAAGNLRARQVDRLRVAPIKGAVTRAGKRRGPQREAPKVHPRISGRSAADQAHRDKLARQWKTVEKAARRAHATAVRARNISNYIPEYPRLKTASKIKGHSRYVRENVFDVVNRLLRSPTRGKNKLTPEQRSLLVAEAVRGSQSIKARGAMTQPRRSSRRIRSRRPAGIIGKPKPRKTAADAVAKPATPSARPTGRFESLGFRPGVFMSAYGRPVGVIGMPKRGRRQDPFGPKDQTKNRNLQIALDWLAKNGYGNAVLFKRSAKNGEEAPAAVFPKGAYYKGTDGKYHVNQSDTPILGLNAAANYWRNPGKNKAHSRLWGWSASSNPVGTLIHEIGHMRDPRVVENSRIRPNFSYGLPMLGQKQRPTGIAGIWRRVSEYATTSQAEFVAETYLGLRSGIRYDHQVMRAYREAMGLPARPPARHRSRRRKPQS